MNTEPYRKLFALGLACGITGVSLWPLFLSGQITYPLLAHSHLMVAGMFLGFVSGFLMTALPKMSSTAPASALESWIAVALIGGSALLALSGQSAWAAAFAAAQFVFLIQFALRRFIRRKSNPPHGFLFVPFGLAWGLFGFSIQALLANGVDVPPALSALAKTGVQQAFLLNLIVGLGSRLIPFLSRVGAADPRQQLMESRSKSLPILVGLNLSFLLEPILPEWSVYLIRALALTAAALGMFAFLKKATRQTVAGVSVRISVLAMIAAYLGLALLPQYRLAFLHIVFIGGYTLLTLMVATRVVLAHGGHSLDREVSSPALIATLILLATAAILRAFSLLPWAAACWLLAVIIWAWSIGRFLHLSMDGKSARC